MTKTTHKVLCMGNENSRMREVSKERERMRVPGIFAIAVLVTFLVTAIPSVSFVATAETAMETGTTKATEYGKGYTIDEISVMAQIPGVDPAMMNQRSQLGEVEVIPIPTEELQGMLLPNYVQKGLEEQSGNPSPQGSPDPEPNDVPFQSPDILVYDDVNSEKNVSMATTPNGDMYIAYDHDPGTGLRDVYVSKSIDGGATWMQRNIATDAAEDESCPSISRGYSTVYGMELLYVWYNNPELEFMWSMDGDTWTKENWGGGLTFWSKVRCPYVTVDGDFIAISAEYYDDTRNRDTWYILYTFDNWQTTLSGYYWIMGDPDPWTYIYQPRVSIVDDDEILVVMNAYIPFDPTPANWFNDTLVWHGILAGSGDPPDDNWDYLAWGSGLDNKDFTSPTVVGSGEDAVFVQEMYNPAVLPVTTHTLICMWTDQLHLVISDPNTYWTLCFPDESGWLAFDVALDQKYAHLHKEGSAAHAVWMNGTDINYRYSPDGGNAWYGDPATGDPMKVNDGVGSVLDAWHSPDITFANGKPGVAWHDTRGGESIYFQTYGNLVLFTLDTIPRDPNLHVWEVGDTEQFAPYSYLWGVGTNHDVQCTANYEDGSVRYTFSHWLEDGSTSNPRQITVNDTVPTATCVYTVEYMLTMVNPAGSTIPVTGYQLAGTFVDISATSIPPGPDSIYTFLNWIGTGLGSYTGPLNPCLGCVEMLGPITETAMWVLQHKVTIYTDPPNLTFIVNGGNYSGTYVDGFEFWFNDSEFYELDVQSPQPGSPVLRYMYDHWSDGGAQMHNVFVTAATSFTVFFLAEYYITFTTVPDPLTAPGLMLQIGGTEYMAPYTMWCVEGSQILIYARSPQNIGVAGEQYIYDRWSDGGNQQHFYDCVSDDTVTAYFVKQYEVTVDTDPTGYGVIVDGTPYVTTPQTFWWNESSQHVLEALATIGLGSNDRLNFSYWSDAGARVHDYWANASETLTAVYDLQHRLILQGNHQGISVRADGYSFILNNEYWCDHNEQVLLEADTYQYFGDTRYVFDRWDPAAPQSHFITCDATGIVTVYYVEEYRVRLNSTLDGLPDTLIVTVGTTDYTTPYSDLWVTAGDQIQLGTYEFQPGTDPISGTRSRWVDWEDGGTMSKAVTINQPGMEFTANFVTQHKLTFSDAHGVPTVVPAGYPVTGGFYFDEGTVVTISTNATVDDLVDASHRWRFNGWTGLGTGSYTGPNRDDTVTMGNPITQTVAWEDQYSLTITTVYGTPGATTNYFEMVSANLYWYDKNVIADFWVPTPVDIATGERAAFDAWSGDSTQTTNRTTLAMSGGMAVTANWHLEYEVTIATDQGTPPAPVWVEEGTTHTITAQETYDPDTGDHTRERFDGWTADTESLNNGGYQGEALSQVLTVTGPITETMNWVTQYEVTITSVYGEEPDTLGDPDGAGWYDDGTLAWVEVAGSVTKGDWIYKFSSWLGGVSAPDLNITTIIVNGPKALEVQWTKEAKSDIGKLLVDLWYIWVIIIIVVVVVVALLLMRKKKPAEPAEMPPPAMEEAPPVGEPMEPMGPPGEEPMGPPVTEESPPPGPPA
jgi:hypothetical protein